MNKHRFTQARPGLLLLIALLLAGSIPTARANVIQANKTYPPPNGSFRAAGPAYNFGSGGSAVQFKDVAFTFFDSFTLIGAPGGSVTFNAQFSHKLSTDGGATWSGEQAATAAFSITLGAVSGNDHSFTINSLTISGGDLPANFQLRKLAVVGTPVATFTPNTPSAGLFTIDNSFYLSLELSQDSGGTWAANTTSGSFGTPSYVLAPLSNEEVTRSPTLPPGDGQYFNAEQYHAAFANGIVVRNPLHNGFIGQSCSNENSIPNLAGTPGNADPLCPPPILGQTQTEDFTSKMRFDIEMPGLVHVGPIDATVRTVVNHSHDSGVMQIFRTRMVRLDPVPGSLPPGMNFRINPDPVKPSLGVTTLRPGPTPDTTNISSSFALRLQMTTDGGATWLDADQFARMQLQILPTITNSIAVVAGFNLITLQLDNTNGLNALETPEDGDQVYRWDVPAQDFDGAIPTYFAGFGWTPEFFPAPGEAFFYVTMTARTLTYTGTPHIPVLPLTLAPDRFYALGRQTNAAGTYENIVGQPPGVGAQFNRWNAANQDFTTNTFNGATWSGGVPSANVSEGVFIYPTVPPVVLSGLLNYSRGDATLSVASNRLTVGNIGSSGQDGVECALGQAAGWRVGLDITNDMSAAGAVLRSSVLGRVNGVDNQVIGTSRIIGDGTNVLLQTDFSSLGSTNQLVSLYDSNNTLIASFQISNSAALRVQTPPNQTPDTSSPCYCQYGADIISPYKVFWNGKWVWCFPRFVTTPTGTAHSNVSSINIAALNVTATTSYASSGTLTAANIPSLILSYEAVQFIPGTPFVSGTGDASLTPSAPISRLVVGNIGSSGTDGALVHLGKVAGWRANLDMTNDLSAAGAVLQSSVLGRVNGVDNQVIGTSRIIGNGTNVLLQTDFSNLGSTHQLVSLYDSNNTLIASFQTTNNAALRIQTLRIKLQTLAVPVTVSMGLTLAALAIWCIGMGIGFGAQRDSSQIQLGTVHANVSSINIAALNLTAATSYASSGTLTATGIGSFTLTALSANGHTITATPSANNVTLTWPYGGTLQASTNLAATPIDWIGLPGVRSPYTNSPSGSMQFFRVIQP